MAENRVIGRDNAMPWTIKGNLAHFKEMTMGWPCIMGRKTWESLPKKPLPGRLNIIVSNSITQETTLDTEKRKDDSEVIIHKSLTDAINFCKNYKKVFICGGESIYKQAMPLANRIDLTLIPGNYEGDTYFPQIDESIWEKIEVINFDEFSILSFKKNIIL